MADTPRKDPLARWRSFTHRGTRIEFIPSGIVVPATSPEELRVNTEREIRRRTKDEPEN